MCVISKAQILGTNADAVVDSMLCQAELSRGERFLISDGAEGRLYHGIVLDLGTQSSLREY